MRLKYFSLIYTKIINSEQARLCFYLNNRTYYIAWATFLLKLSLLVLWAIYHWEGLVTGLVWIPFGFVFLFMMVPGTSLVFMRRDAPALIISKQGLYWQGVLVNTVSKEYFLFWQNIAHIAQEGSTLRLDCYGGAVLSGEPMQGEPIPRNFAADRTYQLKLRGLSANPEGVSTEVIKRWHGLKQSQIVK